jgi:hypothetical protein
MDENVNSLVNAFGESIRCSLPDLEVCRRRLGGGRMTHVSVAPAVASASVSGASAYASGTSASAGSSPPAGGCLDRLDIYHGRRWSMVMHVQQKDDEQPRSPGEWGGGGQGPTEESTVFNSIRAAHCHFGKV